MELSRCFMSENLGQMSDRCNHSVTLILRVNQYLERRELMTELEMRQTQEKWKRHIDAWNARDLDMILSDYSEVSVVIVNNKIHRGVNEIRALFAKLFDAFDRAKEHEIAPAVIQGRVIYITWRAIIDGRGELLGTDTFVVDEDQISYQTITSYPTFV